MKYRKILFTALLLTFVATFPDCGESTGGLDKDDTSTDSANDTNYGTDTGSMDTGSVDTGDSGGGSTDAGDSNSSTVDDSETNSVAETDAPDTDIGSDDTSEVTETDDDTATSEVTGCPVPGIMDGNSEITGVEWIDRFYAEVLHFDETASQLKQAIDNELAAVAEMANLEGGANAQFFNEFQSSIVERFKLNPMRGIQVDYAMSYCAFSGSELIALVASCDAEMDVTSAVSRCKGRCEMDLDGVDLDTFCGNDADSVVICTGQAPDDTCPGTCTGTCQLDVAESCDGICDGVCDEMDGYECAGTCEGTCVLEAGGSCWGRCLGTCEYLPESGSCSDENVSSVTCSSGAAQEPSLSTCNGMCIGEIFAPFAAMECDAISKTSVELNGECRLPTVGVFYGFDETAIELMDSAQEQALMAEFDKWQTSFKAHFSAISAHLAKAEVVMRSGRALYETQGKIVTSPLFNDLSDDSRLRIALCMSGATSETATLVANDNNALMEATNRATGLMMAVIRR